MTTTASPPQKLDNASDFFRIKIKGQRTPNHHLHDNNIRTHDRHGHGDDHSASSSPSHATSPIPIPSWQKRKLEATHPHAHHKNEIIKVTPNHSKLSPLTSLSPLSPRAGHRRDHHDNGLPTIDLHAVSRESHPQHRQRTAIKIIPHKKKKKTQRQSLMHKNKKVPLWQRKSIIAGTMIGTESTGEWVGVISVIGTAVQKM